MNRGKESMEGRRSGAGRAWRTEDEKREGREGRKGRRKGGMKGAGSRCRGYISKILVLLFQAVKALSTLSSLIHF